MKTRKDRRERLVKQKAKNHVDAQLLMICPKRYLEMRKRIHVMQNYITMMDDSVNEVIDLLGNVTSQKFKQLAKNAVRANQHLLDALLQESIFDCQNIREGNSQVAALGWKSRFDNLIAFVSEEWQVIEIEKVIKNVVTDEIIRRDTERAENELYERHKSYIDAYNNWKANNPERAAELERQALQGISIP